MLKPNFLRQSKRRKKDVKNPNFNRSYVHHFVVRISRRRAKQARQDANGENDERE
jgi:hypothetical protein